MLAGSPTHTSTPEAHGVIDVHCWGSERAASKVRIGTILALLCRCLFFPVRALWGWLGSLWFPAPFPGIFTWIYRCTLIGAVPESLSAPVWLLLATHRSVSASGFDLGFYLYYYFNAFLGGWNKISFLRFVVFLPWSSGVKYLTQLRNVNPGGGGRESRGCLPVISHRPAGGART